MSQDNHLYSAFKRPRETLLPYSSQSTSIPQPSSALKRSSSAVAPPRASMAPNFRASTIGGVHLSSSGGGDPAQLGSAVKASAYSARKSLAPGSVLNSIGPNGSQGMSVPGTQRRSSAYSRPSGVGGINSVFSSNAISAGTAKDPRPLRDRNFQARIAQDLLDYLAHNNFEMEMKHQISPNFFKSPTGKDFSTCFEWLYHRIDPNYRFTKPIDQEVLPILKTLRYPYYTNITKAGLAAAGGANNWHTFLGMLHWMYELAVTMDKIETTNYDEAVEAEGHDIAGDRIIFNFLSQSYQAWLQAEDDHQEFIDEMVSAFDARVGRYVEESNLLEAENAELKKTLAELDNKNEDGKTPLQLLEETRQTLEKDKKKFEEYIEKLKQRIEKTKAANERLKQDLEEVEAETAVLEEERQNLQKAVDKQGLTPADIDRMNTERDKLDKGLAQISQKVEEFKAREEQKATETQSKLDTLERAITRYNTLAYQIGITPSTAQHAEGKDYELQLFPHKAERSDAIEEDRLLYNGLSGYQPSQLLNRDVKFDIKPALANVKQKIADQIHALEDETLKNRELIDKVVESYSELSDAVESMKTKLQGAQAELDGIRETMTAEANASNTEIEKLERELQSLRIGLSNGILSLDQKLQAAMIEYDQLQHAANVTRQELHAEVERALNEIIQFKINIQNKLSDFEAELEDEVKNAGKVTDEDEEIL